MTTNENTPAPALVAPALASEQTLTYKEVPIKLTRSETAGKGGKAGVAYWRLDLGQYVAAPGQQDTLCNTLDKLFTREGWLDLLQAKLDVNLKNSQLDTGKDTFTMEQKAQYAKDYINADFGKAARVGETAKLVNALQASNNAKTAMLGKIMALWEENQNPATSIERRVAIAAEIKALNSQVQSLG